MNPLPFIHGYTPADLQNMGMTAAAFHRRSADVNPEPLNLNAAPGRSVFKPRKRCSKASQLPPDIQLSLNTMLARGCRYRDIIHSLNAQGYPGFNKVNLNAWKRTGFQDWLQTRNAETSLVTDQAVLVTGSNR